ncbi:hypothetical protein C8Q78DRAFT_359684 [Trametes maxima]|nr:hypothetical protein C8Q78DRAFT_359684 [Trametes maxima]
MGPFPRLPIATMPTQPHWGRIHGVRILWTRCRGHCTLIAHCGMAFRAAVAHTMPAQGQCPGFLIPTAERPPKSQHSTAAKLRPYPSTVRPPSRSLARVPAGSHASARSVLG